MTGFFFLSPIRYTSAAVNYVQVIETILFKLNMTISYTSYYAGNSVGRLSFRRISNKSKSQDSFHRRRIVQRLMVYKRFKHNIFYLRLEFDIFTYLWTRISVVFIDTFAFVVLISFLCLLRDSCRYVPRRAKRNSEHRNRYLFVRSI